MDIFTLRSAQAYAENLVAGAISGVVATTVDEENNAVTMNFNNGESVTLTIQTPQAKVDKAVNAYLAENGMGLSEEKALDYYYIKSPNGICFKVTISDEGVPCYTKVTVSDIENDTNEVEVYELNLTPEYDTDGNYIDCHAIGIMYHEGKYYMYGESKKGWTYNGVIESLGVNCYSSTDLINWTFENTVLTPEEVNSQERTDVESICIIERPKVIYNELNNNFVMMFHADGKAITTTTDDEGNETTETSSSYYSFAHVGIAVCDTPIGNFELVDLVRPLSDDVCRDLNLFKDEDNKAYLIVSRASHAQTIYELDENYTGFSGNYQSMGCTDREAAAPFKYNGIYYCANSSTVGWGSSITKVYKASDMLGKWSLQGQLWEAETSSNLMGQTTYVIPVEEEKYGYPFIICFDLWESGDLESSYYCWLPLWIDDSGNALSDKENYSNFKLTIGKKPIINDTALSDYDEYVQYELTERFVTDGTNYIDTGIKLCDSDKDYTIFVQLSEKTNYAIAAGDLQNKKSLSFGLNYNSNGIRPSFNQKTLTINSYDENNAPINVVLVKKGKKELEIYTSQNKDGKVIRSYSVESSYNNFNLLIGAQRYGNIQVSTTGSVEKCKVWCAKLSESAIQELLNTEF